MIFPGNKNSGFTLVEMIVVIVITGIIGVFLSHFILKPIEQFKRVQSRAALVDQALSIINMIKQDVAKALPNSIRQENDSSFEMLSTSFGGRYEKSKGEYKFVTDQNISKIGIINTLSSSSILDIVKNNNLNTTTGLLSKNCSNDIPVYLTIGNTSTTDNWNKVNMSLIQQFVSSSGNMPVYDYASATLFPDTIFTKESAFDRFYIVDTPVKYALSSNSLYRYHCYDFSTSASSGDLIAQNIDSLKFELNQNSENDFSVLHIKITIKNNKQDSETITLYDQVQVLNIP